MKEVIASLKDARINILGARDALERVGGREISAFELSQADLYLEGVIKRLVALEADPPAPI